MCKSLELEVEHTCSYSCYNWKTKSAIYSVTFFVLKEWNWTQWEWGIYYDFYDKPLKVYVLNTPWFSLAKDVS